MLRTLIVASCAVGLFAGAAAADVFTGTVKKVDAEKNTITVATADKKDVTFELDKEARIFRTVGSGKKARTEDVPDGLKGLPVGSTVSFFTETKNKKDVVTQIKVEGAPKKK
jgi:Cu/Ag efflux protein CusF